MSETQLPDPDVVVEETEVEVEEQQEKYDGGEIPRVDTDPMQDDEV